MTALLKYLIFITPPTYNNHGVKKKPPCNKVISPDYNVAAQPKNRALFHKAMKLST